MLRKSYKRCQKKTAPLYCTRSDPKLAKRARGGGIRGGTEIAQLLSFNEILRHLDALIVCFGSILVQFKNLNQLFHRYLEYALNT